MEAPAGGGETFIGSLKTWFVTERSVASSCSITELGERERERERETFITKLGDGRKR